MEKYTVISNNVTVHFNEEKEAIKYANQQSSAKVIKHKVIYEFTPKSVKRKDI